MVARRTRCRRWIFVGLAVIIGLWLVILVRLGYSGHVFSNRPDLQRPEKDPISLIMAKESLRDPQKAIQDQLSEVLLKLKNIEKQLSLSRLNQTKLKTAEETEKKSNRCDLSEEDRQQYPQCVGKMAWMADKWRTDLCYANHGVDGSLCSIIKYLHEVEGWCPGDGTNKIEKDNHEAPTANVSTDIDGLMWLLRDVNKRASFAWVRMRIRRMWTRWKEAALSLARKQNLSGRKQKRILIHIGVMTNQSGSGFVERQFTGGPLGEFVQWSDVISCLYLLGHKLIITSEAEQLPQSLSQPPGSSNTSCKAWRKPEVDIVYTDIIGLGQVAQYVRDNCILRIVDSFGTEPAFNLDSYAKEHNMTTVWGGRNFNPRQFNTMFPHTPDNTFLGFVVERYIDDVKARNIPRRHQALVYGKNAYMWSGRTNYIHVFNNSGLHVHGTVYMTASDPWPPEVPNYVINHGVLKGEDLHMLLRQSKIFIGLGFPYEGPAPLEAIANGCVFINPKYKEPQSRENNAFFKGKPTQRKVYSQNDYAAQFVGEPNVYTVDIDDLEGVGKAVRKILDIDQFQANLPYEYTEEGMLQRVNAFTEHHDFCAPDQRAPSWPPEGTLHFLLGQKGMSCKDVCWKRDLICEPSYFQTLNTDAALTKYGAQCNGVQKYPDIFYPAFDEDNKQCLLQKETLLFSCAGNQENLRRLCPCRNYIKGQTALCKGCES